MRRRGAGTKHARQLCMYMWKSCERTCGPQGLLDAAGVGASEAIRSLDQVLGSGAHCVPGTSATPELAPRPLSLLCPGPLSAGEGHGVEPAAHAAAGAGAQVDGQPGGAGTLGPGAPGAGAAWRGTLLMPLVVAAVWVAGAEGDIEMECRQAFELHWPAFAPTLLCLKSHWFLPLLGLRPCRWLTPRT